MIYWAEWIIHDGGSLEDLPYDLDILRWFVTVQAVLTIYIMHISFYSETNEFWDKIGFYVHLIVATFI